MKVSLTTLLMMVLVAIIVAIGGASIIRYLSTNTIVKPQPNGVTEPVTTVVTASDDKKSVSFADSPVNTGGVTVDSLIPDPVNTVYDFYDYVKTHDCLQAKSLQPDYNGCQDVDDVRQINVKLLQAEGNRAAIQVELAFTKNGKAETFDGYLWLKRGVDQRWQIQPDPMPKDQITADEFLQSKAGITPKTMVDAPPPDSDKLKIPLDQLTQTPVEPATIPEIAANKRGEEQTINPEAKPEGNSPPPLVVGKPIDPFGIRTFGSQEILTACWSPDQLRGKTTDKKLQKSTPDHSPPVRMVSINQLKPLRAGLQGSIRTVRLPDPSKKLVALTFDLCERASEKTGYDADVVNYLRDHGIKATFYAGGKWMRSHPEKAKQLMADPQFEIGNHAWTHGNMRVLSGDALQEQVRWTQAQYELLREELAQEAQQCGVSPAEINKIPPLPLSFRYPYGTCSTEALDFMAEQGLPSVQWNIVTADPWRKQTADGIAKTIVQGIKSGSIIISHANGRGWKTSEALPKFIPELQAKGYTFVTVTELLQQGIEVEATDSCYELRPGDNQFYDKKVGEGTE